MGYYHILGKEHFMGSKSIAMGVIQKNMGVWRTGSYGRSPDIDVRIISNFSRIYQKPRERWWSRWMQRLGIL